MKKILLLITFLFIITAGNAQNHGTNEIGILKDGKPKLTMNLQYLDSWEKLLADGGVIMDITKVEIVWNTDGLYFIMGTNDERSIETCIALSLEKDVLYESLSSKGFGLVVTCKGSSVGCHPEIRNGKGFCLPASESCCKVESQISEPILK